ncbi:MAG: DUF3592 domain-containing protein [Segniliparus sp.]|uniref:DUF3592 domain-containing protein n=1 Tax=Segniliparus sp. TaxID=2804064 RepID=UPI003F419FF0
MSESDGSSTFIRAMCWAFIAVGAVFAIVGVFLWQHDRKFLAEAVETQGVVVDYSTDRSTDVKTNSVSVTYKREVQYTANNTAYRARELGASSNVPQLGEKVTVYYDPKNPGHAMVDTLGRSSGGLLFLAAGLLWALLWVAVLVWAPKLL